MANPIQALVVPWACREFVLQNAHVVPGYGHLSHHKTTAEIYADLYWPGVGPDVRRFCQTCSRCSSILAGKNNGRPRKEIRLFP